jgi:D-xylose transport system substrate-binding protein
MPDQGSTRYDEHDWPGFQAELKKICPDCKAIYQNGNNDVALQQQQFNSVIAQGATVVVLDPVDSGAAAAMVELGQAQGIKIVAYDRPIPDRAPDFYVSLTMKGLVMPSRKASLSICVLRVFHPKVSAFFKLMVLQPMQPLA